MAIDYAALAAEINGDPKSLGYAGKSDYDMSVLLNSAGLSGETIFRVYTATEDITAAIVRAEYDALGATAKDYLINVVLCTARIKTGNATLRSQIAQIFAAGTTTRANLTAVASKPASRAEVLFGENATVSDFDVAKALRS